MQRDGLIRLERRVRRTCDLLDRVRQSGFFVYAVPTVILHRARRAGKGTTLRHRARKIVRIHMPGGVQIRVFQHRQPLGFSALFLLHFLTSSNGIGCTPGRESCGYIPFIPGGAFPKRKCAPGGGFARSSRRSRRSAYMRRSPPDATRAAPVRSGRLCGRN